MSAPAVIELDNPTNETFSTSDATIVPDDDAMLAPGNPIDSDNASVPHDEIPFIPTRNSGVKMVPADEDADNPGRPIVVEFCIEPIDIAALDPVIPNDCICEVAIDPTDVISDAPDSERVNA